MACNTLSPEYQADSSGETLVAAVTQLGLPEYVRHELGQNTEHAGGILLEAVSEAAFSEHPEQALRVLDALMAHAPEVDDRQCAAAEKLGLLLGEQDTKAAAQGERLMANLAEPGVLQDRPAVLLVGILVRHGRWEEALICYNVASRKYLAGAVEEQNDLPPKFFFPLIGRAMLRKKLGYAPDEFDVAVREFAEPEQISAGQLDSAEAPSNRSGSYPAQLGRLKGRQILCSREDFALAVENGLLVGEDAEKGVDAYFRAAERALREYSDAFPGRDWHTLLFSVEEMREFAHDRGGDASDREFHIEWADSLAQDDPRPRPWPPERNQRCWCASGRKYKKCCGSPNLR